MLLMKHKSFTDRQPISLFGSKDYERARDAAARFINSIGAEKVGSVTQNCATTTVTVWYREEGDSRTSKDVMRELWIRRYGCRRLMQLITSMTAPQKQTRWMIFGGTHLQPRPFTIGRAKA